MVLTTAVPLTELFVSRTEVDDAMHEAQSNSSRSKSNNNNNDNNNNNNNNNNGDDDGNAAESDEHQDVDDTMRNLMDDLGINMQVLKNSSIFTGDEERFAFARALSRLSEMGSQQWIERGLGLEKDGGREDMESWQKVRSRWREDML